MKHALFFVIFCLQLTCLQAASNAPSTDVTVENPQDEVAKVDQLILATKDTLKRLEMLKDLLVQYKQAEAAALKNPSNQETVTKLVNLAKQVNDLINETYIQEYFAPQFLEELKKFSQAADKKNIPPAR